MSEPDVLPDLPRDEPDDARRPGDDDDDDARDLRAADAEASRRRSMRRACAASCIVLGLGLLTCVGVGALFMATMKARPIGPAERAMIPTVDDLARAVPGVTPTASLEQGEVTGWLDGSGELSYQYEPDDGVMLHVDVSYEPLTREARSCYAIELLVSDLALSASDLDGRPGTFAWGEQSRHQVAVTQAGVPIGHSVVARKGKHIVRVLVVCADLDEARLRAFLVPALDRVASFRP